MKEKSTFMKMAGMLVVAAMLFAALPATKVAAQADDVMPALQSGADRLVEMQRFDGGWGWPLTYPDGDPSALNTIGPIAKGLAEAYKVTGDPDQMSALADAGTFLLAKTNNFSPSDGYLAATLDGVFGGTTYVDHLLTYFYGPLANGRYDKNGAGALYDTAAYILAIRNGRSGDQANLAAWDVGMGLVSAVLCDVDTTEWILGTEAEINELDSSGSYDVIGLAGAVSGLAYAGVDFDPTAGSHVDASSLADLAAILASYQIAGGGFAWNSQWVIEKDFNETIQETAYAILALNEVDRSTYLPNIMGAADYILSVQLATGGWQNDEYYGGENNEITAEALWGIAVAYDFPLIEAWVCESGNCGHPGAEFATIQGAVDAVDSGAQINIMPGSYPVSGTVLLDKPLTLMGPVGDVAEVIGDGGDSVKVFEISSGDVSIQNLSITLDVRPGNYDGLISIPDNAISNITIANNKIFVEQQPGEMSTWWARAIQVGRFVTNLVVSGNEMYNTRTGLVVHYNSSATISDNVIFNTKGGIMNYTGSVEDYQNRVIQNNSWNGVHNEWDIVWNSGGGPYEQDYSESVLGVSQANNDAYVNSLMTVTETRDTLGGNRSHIFVDPSGMTTKDWNYGNMNQPFANLQLALDAVVDGGTVYIAAGTYQEELTIGKSVSILGPNADISPNTGTRVAEAVVAPVDQSGVQDPAITISNSGISVEIKGLKFDMSGTTDDSDRFVLSINQHDNLLTFEHNIYTGAPETINGYWYITGNITPATINIIDNFFYANGVSNGIALWGTGQVIDISDNVWEDNQAWAFNLNNVTGSIRDNRVIDLVNDGSEWYENQLGFLFANALDLDVTGNEFVGLPGTAIRIYDTVNGRLAISESSFTETGSLEYGTIRISDGADLSAVTVESNSFINNPVLVQNGSGTQQLDASPNWWGSVAGPKDSQIDGRVDFAPWCGDAECTFLVDAAAGADLQASIDALGGSGTLYVPTDTYSREGAFTLDGITLILADGTIIQNESPCFNITDDHTKITTVSIGGAKCVATDGASGVVVDAGLTDIVIEGLEITGDDNVGGLHGIEFLGSVDYLQVINNYIHGLTGAGLSFTGVVTHNQGLQGNLFMDLGLDGIIYSDAGGLDATFNSWGVNAAPVIANVTTDPFTYVGLEVSSSGALSADQVNQGGTVTYTVTADLTNVMGADFILTYPTDLLTLDSTTLVTGLFTPTGLTLLDDAVLGQIHFSGIAVGYKPVTATGEVLFTMNFTATSLLSDGTLAFGADEFSMSPTTSVAPSNNVYASNLVDGELSIVELPTITSLGYDGHFAADVPEEFSLDIDNPLDGGMYANPQLQFNLAGSGAILEYYNGSNWVLVASDVLDLSGMTPGDFMNDFLFRITYPTGSSYAVSATLVDTDAADTYLADVSLAAEVVDNFSVSGTFMMQGRTTRSGIGVTLTMADPIYYGPFSGVTKDFLPNNLEITGVAEATYTVTTFQPRYLNVTADLNQRITVNGEDFDLVALELKGGNAVWTDNLINIQDASEVGSNYGAVNASTLDADVNFDSRVNIQDLALVGGNYELTSFDVYNSWLP